ncbi:MAG: hypothetical protein IPF58_16190 [Saprospirales bacterium]|nr:hypothetical protein [Saprospirales bacterium]
MADIVNKDYPCSQKDLYSVLETAWGNNGVHLARFTAFKALYTLPFKTSALSAVAVAKALPDDDARSGASELLHIGLVAMGKVCLQNFQFLKGYIDTAFTDPAVQKVQYVIAGQNNYRDASRGDWESMVSLNTSAKNYLANAGNVTSLTANNNMPAGFVATQKTASDNFDLQYANFKMAEETSVETANKIKANNLCYHAGISMLKDAQVIFMNEPEILTKFVFSNLLALINPPVAGIKGNIKEAVTNAVIGNAKIFAQRDGLPADEVPVDVNGDFGHAIEGRTL